MKVRMTGAELEWWQKLISAEEEKREIWLKQLCPVDYLEAGRTFNLDMRFVEPKEEERKNPDPEYQKKAGAATESNFEENEFEGCEYDKNIFLCIFSEPYTRTVTNQSQKIDVSRVGRIRLRSVVDKHSKTTEVNKKS